ncbi:MAG: hypothetical protein Q8908_16200 [Bacteroidota bacterium]|nr:hypothetical protein [Bacteroidota bacterium]
MKRLKVLVVIALILLIPGCTDFFMICSLNPFYIDKDVTTVHEVEGVWKAFPLHPRKVEKFPVWKQADTTYAWKIERVISKEKRKNKEGKEYVYLIPSNIYMVTLTGKHSDSLIYQFNMVLFRVNKMLYADFMPVDNTGLNKSRFAMESYFSVHTLARVIVRKNQLSFSWLGADYMKGMIENKRVRINYTWVQSARRLLLTATSEQLTGMIERYAGETRFIDWDNQQTMLKLNRIK